MPRLILFLPEGYFSRKREDKLIESSQRHVAAAFDVTDPTKVDVVLVRNCSGSLSAVITGTLQAYPTEERLANLSDRMKMIRDGIPADLPKLRRQAKFLGRQPVDINFEGCLKEGWPEAA